MEPHPERITWRTLAGLLALAIPIGAIAAPLALWVGDSGRTVVVRIAAALFCALVLYRLVVAIRGEAAIGMVWEADDAVQPRAMSAASDPLMLRLSAELRTGLRWHCVPSLLVERLRRLSAQRAVALPPGLLSRPDGSLTWQDAERIVELLERAR